VTEIGEPLPLEKNARLHRYGTITKSLASYGHDVTWWTSSFSHAPKIHIRKQDCKEIVDGVQLNVIHGPGYKSNVSPQRFRHQAHFAGRFVEMALAEKQLPDIIISPVPTIEVAYSAVQLGAKLGVPVLTDIRDQWPDELVDLAPSPFRPFARFVLSSYFKKMNFLCKHAAGVLAISEDFLNYGLKFAGRSAQDSDGIFHIGYSAKQLPKKIIDESKNWWVEQGVRPGSFVCCFFGTIGKFFNLKTIIQSARILCKEMDIQFVLCGTGSSLDECKKFAEGLEGVVLFPGWVDEPKIASLMTLSAVGLAPYRSGARMSLPNKPFEYFSSALPVVSSLQGELKTLLSQHHAGLTYDADSIDSFCQVVRSLHNNIELRETLSSNAKAAFEKNYSTEIIHRKLSDHLIKVVSSFSKNHSCHQSNNRQVFAESLT